MVSTTRKHTSEHNKHNSNHNEHMSKHDEWAEEQPQRASPVNKKPQTEPKRANTQSRENAATDQRRKQKPKDGTFHPKVTISTNPSTCPHTFCLFLIQCHSWQIIYVEPINLKTLNLFLFMLLYIQIIINYHKLNHIVNYI